MLLPWFRMYSARILPQIGIIVALIGANAWKWDVFQIVILFWMQTVLIVAFTLLRVGHLPASAFRRATPHGFLLAAGGLALVLCGGHFLFLWTKFSGDWRTTIHGPVGFWEQIIIGGGAWIALLASLLAGIADHLLTSPHAGLIRGFTPRSSGDPRTAETAGGILIEMTKRVALMQAAIIYGAVAGGRYGAIAPLIFTVDFKALYLEIKAFFGTGENQAQANASQEMESHQTR
jgi:hypothetical protein